jgi:N-acyl-D-aspartate/D-glutamate deacylase
MPGVGRRRFLGSLLGLAGTLAAGRLAADEPCDVVVRGGRLIDPRQGIDRVLDVAIAGDRIAALGDPHVRGRLEIDAAGKVVAPGFVDLMADNTKDPEQTFPIFERYKLTDGVTTPLQLHGGAAQVGAWYDRFDGHDHRTNYGVSTKVMRIRKQRKKNGRRRLAIRSCLEQGALALSHSIEYQPTRFGELVRYGRLAARYDVPLFLHLRFSSPERELDGVREALRVAEQTGCHVHLDHLHSTGASWHMSEAIELVEQALDRGHRITACVYPYTSWATYVGSRRFGPGWQQRYGLTYGDLRVVGTGERLTRRTFRRYRQDPFRLVAVPDGTMSLEETLLPALGRPWVAIASDGGIESEPRANNHPRGAGCFATALRLALDHGLDLAQTVRKMTDLPASLLRNRSAAMEVRGSLRVGDVADLTVFDPELVRGRATVENPNQTSDGIDWVLVAGEVALERGAISDVYAGRPIRGDRAPRPGPS